MSLEQNQKKMQIIPNPPLGHSWESLMGMALEEAKKAFSEDEVPVGALIVHKNGEILAKAHNLTRKNNDPTAHAEIVAIRQASEKNNNFRLLDCYLLVTLEPCIMCLGALREARIEGIIFGARDSEVGAVCSLLEGCELDLKSPKPWFMSGICEDECALILKEFFETKRGS